MASINIFLGTKPLRNEALNIKFTPTDKIQATTVQDAISEVLSKGGVPIVDSVDKLDPNAPQGSLASVVVSALIERKFSIKDISVHSEKSPIPATEFKFNTSNIPSELQRGQYAVFATVGWSGSIMELITDGFQGKVLGFDMQEPGSFIATITDTLAEEVRQQIPIIINGTIDEGSVLNLNNMIESWGGVVFHGIVDLTSGSFNPETPIPEPTEEQYSDWDSLFGYKSVCEEQKIDLYIKDINGWKRYYSELADGSITTKKITTGSVTTSKIADEAIVFKKLSPDIQKILTLTIQHLGIIFFEDKEIETICLTNWNTNGDGFLTKEEVSTVTDISGVFEGNTEIVSFDELSNFTNLTSIPRDAFYNCRSLTSIIIPEGVKSIGDYAFGGCTNLRYITIPQGVTNFGQSTFSNCSSLTAITIPESVTSIGNTVFWACSNLTSVRIYATTPPNLSGDLFYGVSTTVPIYVPDDSVDAYKAKWSSYASQIKPMSEYVES